MPSTREIILMMYINKKKNDTQLFELRYLLRLEHNQLLVCIDKLVNEEYIKFNKEYSVLSLQEKGIKFLKSNSLFDFDITSNLEEKLTYDTTNDKLDFKDIYIPYDLSEFDDLARFVEKT